jgi:hypothetical protein
MCIISWPAERFSGPESRDDGMYHHWLRLMINITTRASSKLYLDSSHSDSCQSFKMRGHCRSSRHEEKTLGMIFRICFSQF